MGGKAELVFACLCGVLLLVGTVVEKWGNVPPWVALTLLIAA